LFVSLKFLQFTKMTYAMSCHNIYVPYCVFGQSCKVILCHLLGAIVMHCADTVPMCALISRKYGIYRIHVPKCPEFC
jgi:hypothetical protein